MTHDELATFVNDEYLREREKWFKRNAYFYEDILRFFHYSVPAGQKILEISFEDGWLLDALRPKRGVHVGVSKAIGERGKKKYPHLTFLDQESFDRSSDFEKFNYLILFHVVGSVSDLQSYFEGLHKACALDTKVIITFYNYLWEPLVKVGELLGLKQKQPIQNWLSVEDMSGLLDLAGFEVIRDGRRLLLPKFIPLLSWFFNRIVGKLPFFYRLNFWNYLIARPKPTSFSPRQYSVSVVIPARNEKEMIEQAVRRIPSMGSETELIFVEGGSTDGTWEEMVRVAEYYHATKRIIIARQEGRGKGDAVRKGFSLAHGDILMILDADLTVPPEELPKFYHVLASGKAEYAHGSRLIYPLEKEAMRLLNLFGNKVFSLILSWLLRQRIKDTLCGTKALFRNHYLVIASNRHYFGNIDPFGDFDLIFGAHKCGLRMAEIPIHYKERTYGTTNISRFRHGFLLMKMCLLALRKVE